MFDYSLIELKDIIVTQGLQDLIGREFSIKKGDYSKESIELIVNYILDYLKTSNLEIKDLETFACGSWIIQFVFNGIYIELHELKDVIDGKNIYGFDLTLTINFFKEQSQLCILKNVNANIPRIGQKIAISKEVYDGSEVNGVRYNSPDHMTGWYLTSNSYNGDTKSLIVDHLYHILKERPDLAKFLALPTGYRFYKDSIGEDVWFDESVMIE